MIDPLKSTKKVQTLGLSSGIATLVVVFKNWAMDNLNTGDSIGFKLVGTDNSGDAGKNIGITWGGKDATNIRIRTSGTTGGKNATINSNSGTSLKLKLVADLDTGNFKSFYDLGDGNGYVDNTGNAGANGITSLDDVNLSVGVQAGTTWATDSNPDNAEIDSITLTVVPEPSSTALLGLGGLALLFRRRK